MSILSASSQYGEAKISITTVEVKNPNADDAELIWRLRPRRCVTAAKDHVLKGSLKQ